MYDLGFYLLFEGHLKLYTYLWISSYLLLALLCGVLVQKALDTKAVAELNWLRRGNQLFLVALGISIIVFGWMVYKDRYSENFELSLLFLFEAFVLMLALRSIKGSTNALCLILFIETL